MGWDAWAALAGLPAVAFALAELPAAFGGAVCARWDDGSSVIVVDPGLGRRQRHEALAHELVHLERECCPVGEVPLIEVREEVAVRREVARRCVPVGALRSFIDRRLASDLSVTAFDVAEQFDCTEGLARLALDLLG